MPTNDHINTRGIGRNRLVDHIARMRQNDDFIHAHSSELINLALNRRRGIREHHIRPRAGQLIGILRREANQANLFTALLDDDRFLNNIAQQCLTTYIGI